MHPVWICIGKWALLIEHIHTIREIPARVPPSLLAGCRARKGQDSGAKFKIRPICAHYSPLQRLQMVAGHLNVPTLCRIPLKNIQMFRWNSVRKTTLPWCQFWKYNQTTNCHSFLIIFTWHPSMVSLFNTNNFPYLKLFSFLPKLVALALLGRLRLLRCSTQFLRAQTRNSPRVQLLGVTAYLSPAFRVGGQVTVGAIRVGIELNHRPKCPACFPLGL